MTSVFQVGDWVTCPALEPQELHVCRIEGEEFFFDSSTGDGVTRPYDGSFVHLEGDERWSFRVTRPLIKPDTINVQLFAVKRDCPSKGFNVAVFPGAPFGPEVVLSLRGRADAEEEFNGAADVKIKTDNPGEVSEISFIEIASAGTIVLIDMETAEEIASMLRFHQMDERHQLEEGEVK